MNTGINRIRLEFKGQDPVGFYSGEQGLIESDWNLKEHRRNGENQRTSRINRIRLEFKVYVSVLGSAGLKRINRIRLEFKVYTHAYV